MVVLVAVFLVLGYWQWTRGESGNARSYGYALQWPAFAIFVVVFWIRMMRDELKPPRPDDAPDVASDDAPAAAGEPVFPDVHQPAAAVEDDPELAAYNAYLARLHADSTSP